MEAHASDVWPAGQTWWRPVVATGYLLSLATLSALFARRWVGWSQLKRIPIAKAMVIALLADSLLFIFASAVILLGVGTSLNHAACNAAIWYCILLYATSKTLIYLFLSEKLYAVYAYTAHGRVSRWQSTQYRVAVVLMTGWLGVAAVMVAGRITELRQNDHACVIGLRIWSTVPMLTMDALINIYLTSAFVIPICHSRFANAQRLAAQSSIAAIAALLTSVANIAVLTAQHGHQLSFVCLGSCGLDVTINALIIYAVTSHPHSDEGPSPPLVDPRHSQSRTHHTHTLPPRHSAQLRSLSMASTMGVHVHVSEETVQIEDDEGLAYLAPRALKRSPRAGGGETPFTSVSLAALDLEVGLQGRMEKERELEMEERSSADEQMM
ncbi:hypothetical protein JCM1841_006427 [Sporobolomyces salmonicolor]